MPGQTAGIAYGPADFEEDDPFPSPAPPALYATQLQVFDGTNPNGIWSLYVFDDAAYDSGYIINGWERVITTTGNSPPVDILLSNPAVAENEPAGTPVGSFSAADPDPGDAFTYELVNGNGDADNASFTISGDVLQTNASFDYETRSSYSIRVRVTDAGGLWFEKAFTIAVADLDEIAPTISSVSINEGASQRSMVKKLSVLFSEPVTLSVSALTIKPSSGAPIPATLSVANPSADPLFNAAFDYEGNGVINALDRAQFRKRYGQLLSY